MKGRQIDSLLMACAKPPETPKPAEKLVNKPAEPIVDYEAVRQAERQEKESDENNPDFQILVRELRLKKGSNGYYRTRDLFFRARRCDVSFDINRYIGSSHLSGPVYEIKRRLLEQGFASEAYNYWRAAQPDRMKYGTVTREKRLEKAEDFARKAGRSLEEIVRERLEKR